MYIKKLSLFLVLLGFVFVVKAQDGNDRIQIGGQYSFPTSDFSKIANNGFGGFVKGFYGVGEKPQQITLELGVNAFKTILKHKTGSNIIVPVQLGYRFGLGNFYLETQAGLSVNKLVEETGTATKVKFGWAPSVGYTFKNIELGVKYNGSKFNSTDTDLSFVGIRLAYSFPLGK